jgi:hypothetical protein
MILFLLMRESDRDGPSFSTSYHPCRNPGVVTVEVVLLERLRQLLVCPQIHRIPHCVVCGSLRHLSVLCVSAVIIQNRGDAMLYEKADNAMKLLNVKWKHAEWSNRLSLLIKS